MVGSARTISFMDTGHSTPRHLANRFESDKLLSPSNQVDPFYFVKTDVLKITSFLGAIKKN
jgi:hypothetical protein